jgi:hypothetical protein
MSTQKKIIWINEKIYDHITIVERMKYIEQNMNGLMPLYGKEKENLLKYAKDNDLPFDEIISLRNTIRIQKEIDYSKNIYTKINKIKSNFVSLIKKLDSNKKQNQIKIRKFFRSMHVPIRSIIKIVSKESEFNNLSSIDLSYIKKIENTILMNEKEIHDKSIEFEHVLEKYLKMLGITFRTEADIKRDKDYIVTPDILFDKPIILQLNNVEYSIRWLDAKNYVLTDTPFIIKSLHKQSTKYYEIFGLGAFVFHYGYDSSINIPNVLILDGSKL